MISLHNLRHVLQDGRLLFDQVSFSLQKGDKVGLVGENGSGKSTLLQLIYHHSNSTLGDIQINEGLKIDLLPQHYGQFDAMPVKEALGFHKKLDALHHILDGYTDEIYFNELAEDWEIEQRIQLAFLRWNIAHIHLEAPFCQLSGGEKTRAFLSNTEISDADVILLDEPSNHLDRKGRGELYEMIRNSRQAMLIVSHDRELLELCNQIVELTALGSKLYGGNFTFYLTKQEEERAGLAQKLQHAHKTLLQEGKKHQELLQSKQRLQAKSKQKHQKKGTDKIQKHALKEKSEQSSSKLKKMIASAQEQSQQSLQKLLQQQQKDSLLKLNLGESHLHEGKCLLRLENANVIFEGRRTFKESISLEVFSGDRLAIEGDNGSGKSTLLRILNGAIPLSEGGRFAAQFTSVILDQDYSLIDRQKTVYEQIQDANDQHLLEHELKIRLNRFLFDESFWNKKCAVLSGGELLRLSLCTMMVREQAPDLIMLDEPTNNLDLKNIDILSKTMQAYQGTLLLVSHDRYFKEEVGITRKVHLR